MIPGARLVMLGRQGAGKGTQCARLSRHYVVPHISTGDMLRAAVREGTAFGRKAEEFMSAGELLPDDIMVGIVDERLERDDTRTRGFILDGFPRTVAQAEALDRMLSGKGMKLDSVIELKVDEGALVKRMENRVAETISGGEQVRKDDNPEAFRIRLENYREQTAPVSGYYASKGVLKTTDGMRPIDEVTQQVFAILDAAKA